MKKYPIGAVIGISTMIGIALSIVMLQYFLFKPQCTAPSARFERATPRIVNQCSEVAYATSADIIARGFDEQRAEEKGDLAYRLCIKDSSYASDQT
jgi:hypothetical protein